MTEQEINKAIADHFGYDLIGGEWHMGGMLVFTETGARWKPTYCNDLNAMHEAEKSLSVPTHSDYICQLYYKTMGLGKGICDWQKLATATAAQRAEAFLKTLNLWK